MSRSNPHESGMQNPAIRWFEWNGEQGTVRYYDKEAKKNVDVGADFSFVLLDQLGSVRGWDDRSQSGIYSNEVKDTRQEVMIVRAFKGGTLAEGIYKNIKDRVNSIGGQFVANCYIAFKHNKELAIGSIKFKGAALSAWMDFCKAHRADLFKKGICINGFNEGKKGRIVYRVPLLKIVELSESTNHAAMELDVTLQEFLVGYLKKNKHDQVESTSSVTNEHDYHDEPQGHDDVPAMTDEDIPF